MDFYNNSMYGDLTLLNLILCTCKLFFVYFKVLCKLLFVYVKVLRKNPFSSTLNNYLV